jgi:hypothetical protein
VFPYSPEANPTLTLAALSLRLSRKLVPRLSVALSADESHVICVINHSGRAISVFISNSTNVPVRDDQGNLIPNNYVELREGMIQKWARTKDTPESICVKRINPKWDGKDKDKKYWYIPEVLVGMPGQIMPIL